MKIAHGIEPATPWNVTLARLAACEQRIGTHEKQAFEARWEFGRELVKRRVEYKGRLGIPADLMKLTIAQSPVPQREINYRVQFALRYPTKKEMCEALAHFGSWFRMTREGLIEKKRDKKPKPNRYETPFVLRRLNKELDKAFHRSTELSRADVKAIEALIQKLRAVLEQVDRNDDRKAVGQ